MVIPSHDDMDRDLRLLTQQQEKLVAELQKAAAVGDGEDGDVPLYDSEMEERVAQLNIDENDKQRVIAVSARLFSAPACDVIVVIDVKCVVLCFQAMKDCARTSATRANKLREQLRRRQERSAQRALKGVENLSGSLIS